MVAANVAKTDLYKPPPHTHTHTHSWWKIKLLVERFSTFHHRSCYRVLLTSGNWTQICCCCYSLCLSTEAARIDPGDDALKVPAEARHKRENALWWRRTQTVLAPIPGARQTGREKLGKWILTWVGLFAVCAACLPAREVGAECCFDGRCQIFWVGHLLQLEVREIFLGDFHTLSILRFTECFYFYFMINVIFNH